MKSYLVTTTVVSAIFLLAYFLINDVLISGFLHDKFPILIGFFFLQSFPIAWILSHGEKDIESFHWFAIAGIGFRMITGLFLLLVFFYLKVEDIVQLAIQFTVVYLVYLVFELSTVLANLRRN